MSEGGSERFGAGIHMGCQVLQVALQSLPAEVSILPIVLGLFRRGG